MQGNKIRFELFVDIVAAAVLSGNRNFEGRVHPLTRANYLASPPLVVAYALAGTVGGSYNNFRFSSTSKISIMLIYTFARSLTHHFVMFGLLPSGEY